MLQFLVEHWEAILLSLTTAGALAFCRHIWKQLQKYKSLVEEKETDAREELIDKKIEPIVEEIEELRKYIRNTETKENRDMSLIISSYKYRLVQLCKQYNAQGYMTQDQYDQLSEFYKLYTSLGGNGQAKEYYEKAIKLEVKPHHSVTK